MDENTPIAIKPVQERHIASAADLLLLPSVLGVLVSCAAMIAVFHDLGFFWVVGMDFINVLTTADLIKSTANWLLPLAVPAGIWILWEIKSPTYTPYLSNYYQQGLLSKRSIATYWAVFRSNKIYTLISLLMPINLIFIASWYVGVGTLILILFTTYLGRKVVKSIGRQGRDVTESPYFLSLVTLSALGLIGFYLGFIDGEVSLNKNHPVYMIKADKLDDYLVVLVRNSEKGVLAKQGDLYIFVPWDNIKSLARRVPKQDTSSVASRLYHWWVDPPPPGP